MIRITHRLLISLIFKLAVPDSSTATQDPDIVPLQALEEHWRWKHYWYGKTELGPEYIEGRKVEILLFWDHNRRSVGFCSRDLRTCQLFAEVSKPSPTLSMAVPEATNVRAAYGQFLQVGRGPTATVFDSLRGEATQVKYQHQLLMITLPRLDPPRAVRERKVRPTAEIEQLRLLSACPGDHGSCKSRLMVPYYGDEDPLVPVYRECSSGCKPERAILLFRLTQGEWFLGATNVDTRDTIVIRTKSMIMNALMKEF